MVPVRFFATLVVVGSYRDNYIPGLDAPDRDFVQFYVDNFSKIPVTSTMFIIGWALILVVLVALVRTLNPRLTLSGMLAIAFASISTAVSVASQGLFTYPTILVEMTAETDPRQPGPGCRTLHRAVDRRHFQWRWCADRGGVADGGAARGSQRPLGPLGRRSGRRLMGVAGSLNMVLGGSGSMTVGMIPFGIFVGVVLLIARSQLDNPQTLQPGPSS